jgi:hypothetical protein
MLETQPAIKNTSRYPTAQVLGLLAFGMAEVWSDALAVNVKNSRRAYAGRAYAGVPGLSPASQLHEVRRLVTIRLGRPDHFPVDNLCTTWKYHPWQAFEAPPPAGYDPACWGRRLRRTRRAILTRFLEPVRHPYGGKRSPLILMRDWREALVAVAAHEARHIWQFETGARRSEVDAEQFAAQRLAEYRCSLQLPLL